MISRVLRAQVCAQRCAQPGQTWSGRLSPSPFLARRRRCARRRYTREDLLADLRYQTVQFGLGHDGAFLQILLLDVHDLLHARLVPAAGKRGPSQVRKTSSAWVWVSSRAPSVSTLESLCSRLLRAEALS